MLPPTLSVGEAPSPAPEVADPIPDTVLSKIATNLSAETETESTFNMTPTDLSEYVKSLSLPQGAKINAFNTEVVGDHLVIKGNVTAKGGNSTFSAEVKTDPAGKIIVANQAIMPALRHRPFMGSIRNRIDNLDSELTNALNSQLSNGWKVEGFGLSGPNINIKFNKTS